MEKNLTLSRLGARVGSDADLFVRAAASDPVAFAEIYRRYHKRIHGFCLARVMNPEAAEDATQEVFLQLLQADATTVDNPRAWMYGVARHVSTDALRRRMRLAETDPADEDSPAWAHLTSADSAEKVMGRETARNIFLTLRKLNSRYRTALILRELHGQSSVEIAEALDTTVGAVDTLVSRARDAFGKTYAEVSDLPPACANTVELIYRRLGTGIDDAETQRVDSHVKSCGRCRAELKRATDKRGLSGLLPMLIAPRAIGPIPQALIANPAAAHLLEQCAQMTWLQHATMGAAAAAVAAVVVVSGAEMSSQYVPPRPVRTPVASPADPFRETARRSVRTIAPAVTPARETTPVAVTPSGRPALVAAPESNVDTVIPPVPEGDVPEMNTEPEAGPPKGIEPPAIPWAPSAPEFVPPIFDSPSHIGSLTGFPPFMGPGE